MPQFDVYRLPNGQLVMDLQSSLIDVLVTRVVVPLVPESQVVRGHVMRNLNPAVEVDGERQLLATHLLATVPAKDLRHPVASLAAERDRITRALDVLYGGV